MCIFFFRYVSNKSVSSVSDPKLLLVKGAIVFDKYRDKYESLADTASEEEECVRNMCRRIEDSGANVVLVEKDIAASGRARLERCGVQVNEILFTLLLRFANDLWLFF